MEKTLNDLRGEIDRWDRALIEAFCARMEVSREIGAYKKERGLPVLDAAREEALLKKVEALGGEHGGEVRELYAVILRLSKAAQEKL